MVYKKYIKRDGKIHGPYLYRSKKVDGKVITEYLGLASEVSPKKIISKATKKNSGPEVFSVNSPIHRNLFFVLGFILIVALLFLLNPGFTGKVALQIEDIYSPGEAITGNLKMSLQSGELIPASTKVIVDNSGSISEYLLSDLISEELINGSFYADGKSISGEGEGYGFIGGKKIYPTLNFELQIKNLKEESETESSQSTETTTSEPETSESESQTETQTSESETETESETSISESETSEISETETKEQSKEINPDSKSKDVAPKGVQPQGLREPASRPSSTKNKDTPKGTSKGEESLSEEGNKKSESSEPSTSETPSSESPSSETSTSESSSPITGDAVNQNTLKGTSKIEGQVSKDNSFSYGLGDGETAEIKSNSVKFEGERIGDENVNLEIKDGSPRDDPAGPQAIVSTDYYIIEQGYGAEYLTGDSNVVNIDLTSLGLVAADGEFVIRLVYEDNELASSSESISVVNESTLTSVPSPTENKSLSEEGNITEIIEVNITKEINETEILKVIENVTTLQYKAVIGRPVKWIKTAKTNSEGNLTIELPKKAVNITFKTNEEVVSALKEINGYEEVVTNADKRSLITGEVTGQVSLDIEKEEGLFYKLWKMITSLSMTGNTISEEDFSESISETIDSREIDVDEILIKANVSGDVDVGVEYYTDAPSSMEEIIAGGKKITISADDGFGYEDILAYTMIDENITMGAVSKIKIYWYVTQEEYADMQTEEALKSVSSSTKNKSLSEEGKNSESINETQDSNETIENNTISENVQDNSSAENITIEDNLNVENVTESQSPLTGNVVEENNSVNDSVLKSGNTNISKLIRVEVLFNAYDLDEDGYVDYVEWIVPHLSEQVYELIYIEKAIHLDSDRNFISDIYNEVSQQDGVWSETINNSEYVRVTFEQELDNTKDITIYARSVCNEFVMINGIEVPCDIYEKKKQIDEIRREME